MSLQSDLRRNKLYKIWSQVPVTYYQKGVKQNILQWIWHSHKINLAKQLLTQIKFKNCLDVGCASGYMISEIAKSYPTRCLLEMKRVLRMEVAFILGK